MRLSPAVVLAVIACRAGSAQTYTISTFAGGGLPVNIPGTSASLAPQGIAVDANGNLYFGNLNPASVGSDTVLRLDATTGLLTLVAGNGTAGFSGDDGLATKAQLNSTQNVAVDAAGNIYIADPFNHRIRRVSNGVITTVAGNGTAGFSGDGGPAATAQITLFTGGGPSGIAVDSAGNLYFADIYRIRKVSNGVITTIAGNGTGGFSGDGGPATSAEIGQVPGIAVDSAGNLYIADQGSYRIRKVSGGVITTVAGSGPVGGIGPPAACSGDGGPATSAQLYNPFGVAVDSAGNIYIADGCRRVRKLSNGAITTIAGNGTPGFSGDGGPATNAGLVPDSLAVDSAGNIYIADSYNGRIREVSNGLITTIAGNGAPSFSGANGPPTSARLGGPSGIAVDSAGSLYIADDGSRGLKVSGGSITVIAGTGVAGFTGDNGPATAAELDLSGVAADSAGNLYIADTGNARIRKISGGIITTVAGTGVQGFSGDGGPATSAELSAPSGVAVDSAGNLYIADASSRIRTVANGVITTVAGPAQLNLSTIAVDSNGNVYINDNVLSRIRKIANGVITTVAGNGTYGFSGDGGPATSAELNAPSGVAVDGAGNLYIADSQNSRIRRVSDGVITTIAGDGTRGFGGDSGPATNAQFNYPTGVSVDNIGNVYVVDSNNDRIRVLTPGTAPSINPSGIVPNDATSSIIQSGSWISIYGRNLAPGTFLWNADFPKSLGGVSVNIDNQPAYLWFVTPTQINLQVPDDTATGTVSVAVTTPSGTATSSVTLAPQGPSFSLLGDGKHVAGQIATTLGNYDLVGPANTFSYATRPVKVGEILTLYGVGFGPTMPHVVAGQVFSGSAPTVNQVTISIGGVNENVTYSGISEAGLYQFNLSVLPGTPGGDQPLLATVNGIQTPAGPVVTIQ